MTLPMWFDRRMESLEGTVLRDRDPAVPIHSSLTKSPSVIIPHQGYSKSNVNWILNDICCFMILHKSRCDKNFINPYISQHIELYSSVLTIIIIIIFKLFIYVRIINIFLYCLNLWRFVTRR